MVSKFPPLLLSHLIKMSNPDTLLDLWNRILPVINDLYCDHQEPAVSKFLRLALEALRSGKLSSSIRASSEYLTNLLDGLYAKSLADDFEARNLLVPLLTCNGAY
jgi:hypothetical protein